MESDISEIDIKPEIEENKIYNLKDIESNYERKELTLNQKIFLLKNFYKSESPRSVQEIFQSKFEIETKEEMLLTIPNLVQVFEATGSIQFTIFFDSKKIRSQTCESSIPKRLQNPEENYFENQPKKIRFESQESSISKQLPLPTENQPKDFTIVIPKNSTPIEIIEECISGEIYSVVELPKRRYSRFSFKKFHLGSSRRVKRTKLRMNNFERTLSLYCGICKEAFEDKALLGSHLKTHENKMVCGWCSDPFPSLLSLQRHILIHTEETPYKCDYCGDSFRDIENRIKHQQVHTGDRQFLFCDVCGKTANEKNDLKDHLLHSHDITDKRICKMNNFESN